MFTILFWLVFVPALFGVVRAVLLLADRPFPIIHERRRPHPNPFR